MKRNGVDIHSFKEEYLGKKALISRYDIYVDTTDDILWLGTKTKGNTKWIQTNDTLNNLLFGGW